MIWIYDDFLDQEDLQYYLQYIQQSKLAQSIVSAENLTRKFWSKYAHKLPQFSGIDHHVTITANRTPIGRHRDEIYGDEKYKILIYLNNVPNGGTIFYLPDGETRLLENKQNRLAVFDIGLQHQSQPFARGQVKYIIGFRPL